MTLVRWNRRKPMTMKMLNFLLVFFGLATAGLGLAADTPTAAEKSKAPANPKTSAKPDQPVFTDPAKAGPDFVDQGEYANDWGGAQVIALGNDKFRLVIFKGGLPGAGWDKSQKMETEGKRQGSKIVFALTTNGFTHTLAEGVLTTTSDSGDTYTMKKLTRASPSLGEKPPPGAIVLFDGSHTDAWANGRMDERHLLAAGTKTKKSFSNFTLHVEFQLPFKPLARGQARGNSGVYLLDRYEIQVLDSFGLKGDNNECGALYKIAKPSVNMCFPPLSWQTYDIDFQAPQFGADGKKTRNAVVTVKHNGEVIHDHLELPTPTGGGKARLEAASGPIQLQAHGNPVFYRNIWIVEK